MRFASARSYAVISVLAAIATIVIKTMAWRLTGSVGLLSDAIESSINLIAALMAFWALGMASKPADRSHSYGHSKAEYFSSGLESALIVVAAFGIIWAAAGQLANPSPLQQVDLGLALSLVATAINAGVALLLMRAAKRFRSITLRADAQHLLSDVWTSVGIVLAIALVQLTGWSVLDPLVAIAVAIQISITGFRLLRETANGLMDRSLPEEELQQLEALLQRRSGSGIDFHALRTRVAGSRRFVSLHVLVPGGWTVKRGHDYCETLEQEVCTLLDSCHVFTHLEPIEDPVSWQDGGFRWENEAGA
jgi:cation diffusion facilitator family transporter